VWIVSNSPNWWWVFECGSVVSRYPGGRPFALGLFGSVAMVLALLRHNIIQQIAAEMVGASQATVSRRVTALGEVLEAVLADFVPTPAQLAGHSTVLVEGTLVPTADWRDRRDLFSGKHHDTGFTPQIGATRGGNLVAVGAAVLGARHDAYAGQASGLAQQVAGLDPRADLGHVGAGQILTGHKKPPGGALTDNHKQVNTDLGHPRRRRTRTHPPQEPENPLRPLPKTTRQTTQHHPDRRRPGILQVLFLNLVNKVPESGNP
jgi:hypothetical protein